MKNTMKKLLSLLLVAVLLGTATAFSTDTIHSTAATTYPSNQTLVYDIENPEGKYGIIAISGLLDFLSGCSFFEFYSGDQCIASNVTFNDFPYCSSYCITKVVYNVNTTAGTPSFNGDLEIDYDITVNYSSNAIASFDIFIKDLDAQTRLYTFTKDIPISVYNGLVQTGPVFPAGYDFDRDRYSFGNITDTVSLEIYQDVFGSEKGEIVYRKKELNSKGKLEDHGLCYGMAVTTGSMLLDIPHVNSFVRYVGPCEYISDINRGTRCYELDAITAKTFIKYGYASQFSTQADTTFCDCEALYNAVYDYVYNGGVPVTISLKQFDYKYNSKEQKWEWKQSFGHRVLAVGLSGNNGIIIDDSNKESEQTIWLTRDSNGNFTNEFTYSGYAATTNGTNILDEDVGVAKVLGYNTAVVLPFLVIDANAQLTYPDSALEDEDVDTRCETKVIDTEYNLLYVSDSDCSISSDDNYLFIIDEPEMGEETEESNGKLHWINNTAEITVSDFNDNESEIIVAGNEVALKAIVSKDSSIHINLDEESKDIYADITATIGDSYAVSLDSSSDSGNDIDLTVSGTAAGSTITATQTETGLIVTGISDGTVTLSKDDEVIATQTISNAISDIEITYDKTGEDESIEVDYEQPEEPTEPEVPTEPETPTEPDVPTDPEPDEPSDNTPDCSCLCHSKDSFIQLIYTIIRFWQLFGMNMDCACGAKHFDSYFFA